MTSLNKKSNILSYKGSNNMRQRLVLSVLSGKSVKIDDIRKLEDDPGIREFEVNLIRLLDKITNGTIVELNETGTSIFFQPGLLHGGSVQHECSLQRSVGYYLEVLAMLGLFCKEPLNVTLYGVTNSSLDPSADYILNGFLPCLRKFVIDDENLQLKIIRRGMLPNGGGEVRFTCPVSKQVRPVQLLDAGMVKRVRGVAYALRVSPSVANRMVDSAKGVLLKFLPDVFISTDQRKGLQSGKSPGFGIHLVAETTQGVFYVAEQMSQPATGGDTSLPEDVGLKAAQCLLQQIYLGGCVDPAAQSVAALLMALSRNDVSKIMVGPLSSYTISFLRHLRDFFGLTFHLERCVMEDDEDDGRGSSKIHMTCVGIGYSNLNKRTI